MSGLTRRTVLAGAAAAGLIGPTTALAHDDLPLFSEWVGAFTGATDALAAPRRFALVGVEWAAPAGARIELRARARGGAWSRWVPASVAGHGPDRVHRATTHTGEPIWTGPADVVQLRSSVPVRGVRLHFVSAPVPGGASAAAALPLAQPVLDAGPGQPPIIARQAWSRGKPPAVPPAYGTVKLAFVHHTENPNGYSAAEVPAMLLAIYQFHRFVRGWNDIGYNFVIDLFGRIWEARQGGIDRAVIGAQAGGYNAVSTGVAVLGTFMDTVPSTAALQSLERLLAWKLSLHGVPSAGHVTVRVPPADAFYTPFKPGARVSLPRVAGHRDGDATACPGDAFYARLPALRPRVTALAGTPSVLKLTADAAAPLLAPATVVLSGRLTRLGGGPIGGATVELQALGSSVPLQTLVTAGDGTFSAKLVLARNTAVSALYRGTPAAVSDVITVEVEPRVELSVDSVRPLMVSGQVVPATRRVAIDVYGRRRLVESKRVAVRRGRFSARLPTPRGGHYRIVARTPATARYAPGSSKPVAINV